MKPHCLVCDKELEVDSHSSLEEDFPCVHDALSCRAEGNYGSTIYDPMVMWSGADMEYLHFYICDSCIMKKSDKIRQVVVKRKPNEFVFTPGGEFLSHFKEKFNQ